MNAARRSWSDPPGGTLPWLIVLLELGTFSIVFVAISMLRRSEPKVFAAGTAALSQPFGLGLTLLLLTSGAAAASGVRAYRVGERRRSRARLLGAAGLGLGFVVVKLLDYAHHAARGHGLGADLFWDTYVLATGFHLLHVVVGVAVLGMAARAAGREQLADPETSIAGPALFWHMCDVVWFILWPLLFVGGKP